MADKLACRVMPYAWGSRTVIAELLGLRSPSDGPEAEMWMGAHPMAPSSVARGPSLTDVIARDPAAELGAPVMAAFGPRLPFLMKVLAAAEPLSLQAHPSAARARAGFEEEDARGIPRDAPHRNYRDPSHKPELLCALTPVDALCGFRDAQESVRLFDALGVRELDAALSHLRGAPHAGGLAGTFRALMTMPGADRAAAVTATVIAAEGHDGAWRRECGWAVRIAKLYPGDIGVVSALLLNLVHLEPGDAIYLDAGNLHAYLDGAGVELMASSDNVLRGGLTKKHVDVPELLAVLDFTDGPVSLLRPRAIDDDEGVYDTPAPEFRLSVIEATQAIDREAVGPEIILCTQGSATVAGVPLARGESVFLPASTGRYGISGAATLYRATVAL